MTACQIAEKYQFSFYDSLIIASALKCDCYTLYSEDLQHGQIIEDKLKIINPFFLKCTVWESKSQIIDILGMPVPNYLSKSD
jgi:hypothetical protein